MSNDTCAFCLGGATEVPPFGTLKDARDLVTPCSTCSLVTHRKCLIDWFNAIPATQITREFPHNHTPSAAAPGVHGGRGSETPHIVNEEPTNGDDADINFEDAADNDNTVEMSFDFRFLNVFGRYSRIDPAPASASSLHVSSQNDGLFTDSGGVSLSTPCPQCKAKIVFRLNRSRVLTLTGFLKSITTDTVQYSGILLGLTGAATGIVTMGYVGLARCGVSFIDALVPPTLVAPLFRRGGNYIGSAPQQTLSASLNGAGTQTGSYFSTASIKFNHIPLVPIVLYRMRYSSVLDLIFKRKPRAQLTEWATELLVCNFISSSGNHSLAKALFANAKSLVSTAVASPMRVPNIGLLFRNIDWWDPKVMLGLTIPGRWLYELVYRSTVNRLQFDLNTSVRPRDIANIMKPEDLSKLERLETQLAGLKYKISTRFNTRGKETGFMRIPRIFTEICGLLGDHTFSQFLRLRILQWFCKTKACIQHDYSSSLLHRSVIITAVTTFLWPFLSADMGRLVYSLLISKLPSLASVEKDKLVFLSNLIGMALVALLKDIGNLYLCHQKARQLSELTVVTERERHVPPKREEPNFTAVFPGAYNH